MPTWREAITTALYGSHGFYVTGGTPVPAAHFRTSAQSGAPFARAVLELLHRVDRQLGHPDRLDLVDLGAGGGELLTAVHQLTGTTDGPLAARLRLTGVDLAPRPAGLPHPVGWRTAPPTEACGVLVATEWLDNVPLDLAVRHGDDLHYVLVDPATGAQRPGGVLADADAAWLARWWPPLADGASAELGRSRDEAWAAAVRTLRRGVAVAVDYGHRYAERPATGTLTGFRAGRSVAPVPDGSCDITAHVAIDSVAAAGATAAAGAGGAAAAGAAPPVLRRQRDVLPALGVSGGRPPLALAGTDPRGYLAALSAAGTATELTDPYGLGGHWWLIQPVGADIDTGSLLA
ncbi:SAM-dependent methyltransferase [Micromonospora sp. LOL_023]|uniref:SAM-dependent methyltransferase n=1 Tax=Micromonospora sp. LOL_023 TaxID=3345418 RepID=UPI003A86496F